MCKHFKLLFLSFLCIDILTSCGKSSSADIVANELEIRITNAEEVTNSDTHGGFNGDGTTYVVLKAEDSSVLDQVEGSSSWHVLPMDEVSEALAYGLSTDYGSVGPYLTDESGAQLLPTVRNGYYCLINRSTYSKLESIDDIRFAPSFNFTLAIYDKDTNLLYFSKLDT